MVVTTPSTITPLPTCDNYKTEKCILTLTIDLLTPKFDVFILAAKSVSGES